MEPCDAQSNRNNNGVDIDSDHPDRKHGWAMAGGGYMGIELIVFATVFTLIVLLTGGPGPHA